MDADPDCAQVEAMASPKVELIIEADTNQIEVVQFYGHPRGGINEAFDKSTKRYSSRAMRCSVKAPSTPTLAVQPASLEL